MTTEAPNATTRIEVRDPVSGEVFDSFDVADDNAVRSSVHVARQSSQEWRLTHVRDRARVLERFRRNVVNERNAISRLISRETGKRTTEAFFEVFGAAEFAHYYAKLAPRRLAPRTWRSSNLAVWRKLIRTDHEPYGVLGVITPWNYPFLLASGLVLPGLVAGNGIVLKPSEKTPSSAELLRELLIDSGLPHGVLQIVHGRGETGSSLVSSEVDKIFFIGSEQTGRKISRQASETMTPCVLELGGSDPAIVLDDADIETAAEGIAWGRFMNAGQTCVAPKRAFVVSGVYDEFMNHLSSVVSELSSGGDGDVGPVISADQTSQIHEQLDDALRIGATVHAKGVALDGSTAVPATVLADTPSEARVLREETFGPVLPVVRVRDEEEAIARANDTSFGLSASVWSRDMDRARRIADRLEAGTVTINDSVIVALLADMPYGGVKQSGTGRTHGEEGLMECVRSRSTIIDRFARYREAYWHFYNSKAGEGFEQFLVFAHGSGLFRRIRAGLRAVWLLYLDRSGRR